MCKVPLLYFCHPVYEVCHPFFFLQEGVKTENDHINLKVAGQDGSVVQFKIKRHTPLNKLMKAYCERQVTPLKMKQHLWNDLSCIFFSYGVTRAIDCLLPDFLQGLAIRQIRFRFDGQPINETDTPAQVWHAWRIASICSEGFNRGIFVKRDDTEVWWQELRWLAKDPGHCCHTFVE